MRWRVVRTGSWLYDASVSVGVWLIEADYDFWHEIVQEDGMLEPDDVAHLNEFGLQYYAVFREPDPESGSFWAETGGADTIAGAAQDAQAKVSTPIAWGPVING